MIAFGHHYDALPTLPGDPMAALRTMLSTAQQTVGVGSGAAGALGIDVSKLVSDVARWRGQAEGALSEVDRLRAEADRLRALAANYAQNPASLLEWVRLETAYGPTIQLASPLVPRPLGPPTPIERYMMFLRPRITVKAAGFSPFVMAPYGEPGPTQWGLLVTAGSAAAAGALALLTFRSVVLAGVAAAMAGGAARSYFAPEGVR